MTNDISKMTNIKIFMYYAGDASFVLYAKKYFPVEVCASLEPVCTRD
jgi:hypothetical protein